MRYLGVATLAFAVASLVACAAPKEPAATVVYDHQAVGAGYFSVDALKVAAVEQGLACEQWQVTKGNEAGVLGQGTCEGGVSMVVFGAPEDDLSDSALEAERRYKKAARGHQAFTRDNWIIQGPGLEAIADRMDATPL